MGHLANADGIRESTPGPFTNVKTGYWSSTEYAPNPDNTFRLSFNRAFRAPSMINNFLDITIFNSAELPPIPELGLFTPTAVFFPARAVGNPKATEEELDAVEIGYVGTFGRNTFTAAIYRNETKGSIDFFTAANHDNAAFFITNPPIPAPLSRCIKTVST